MTRISRFAKKLSLSLTVGVLGLSAAAQTDSTKTFVVSGSVDGYYRYNFSGKPNNLTSFTNSQNSFELGMATLRADGTALSGKLAATADLGFGRRAEEFSYTDGNGIPQGGGNGYTSLSLVKQLYVSYTPSKLWTFTLGKWATHVGYEVVDAYANRNYSMDYMFSFGPFSHTGVKAQYTKGNLGFMIGVANPTDNVTTTSNVKTLIAQFSDSIGKVKAYLNYQGFFGANHGSQANANVTFNNLKSLNQLDLVLSTALNSKWSLGYNGTVQFRTDTSASVKSKTWWGSALYVNYDPKTAIGWTLRGEYVGDADISLFPSKSLYDITLSMNYRVGNQFTIIPEIRLDGANTNIFTKNDGTSSKTTFAGLVAAVYKF